jgi:hypothetical protein
MDDLISRNAVLSDIDEEIEANQEYPEDKLIRKCLRIARKCIENAPAVNRWIPVEDALPESEREVLVYVKGDFDNSIPFITTAYINSDHDWESDYDGEVIDSKITHWMPLPEPPEKE